MTGASERQVPAGKLSRASSLVYGRSLCVDFSRLNRATLAIGWRKGVQPEQLWHRRRARTPGEPQAEDQRADRGQRMAVDGAQIDRPAAGVAREAG
jgi:hypothetical protein